VNRKDTIIIAVLINAGLLAVLFMMAINNDEEPIANQTVLGSTLADNHVIQEPTSSSVSQSQSQLQPQVIDSPVKILADVGSIDEMDNFLKDLSSNNLSQSAFVEDEGMVDLDNDLAHMLPEKTEDINSPADMRLVEVIVKRGDALEKIARNNGTTVDVIKKINKLSSSKLNIGQVLRIPVPIATSSPSSPQTVKTNSVVAGTANSAKVSESKAPDTSEQKYYTIKSGDNPWKIAKEHKVKYDDILKWNGMDEEKARNLKVGDKIRVK
jgi:LysM repeat protein